MSIIDRHYHLLRRLHSLSGVFPVGLFLLPHLTTNSSIVWGRFLGKSEYGDAGVETFQHEVDFIHSLPALEIIEWTVLFEFTSLLSDTELFQFITSLMSI